MIIMLSEGMVLGMQREVGTIRGLEEDGVRLLHLLARRARGSRRDLRRIIRSNDWRSYSPIADTLRRKEPIGITGGVERDLVVQYGWTTDERAAARVGVGVGSFPISLLYDPGAFLSIAIYAPTHGRSPPASPPGAVAHPILRSLPGGLRKWNRWRDPVNVVLAYRPIRLKSDTKGYDTKQLKSIQRIYGHSIRGRGCRPPRLLTKRRQTYNCTSQLPDQKL